MKHGLIYILTLVGIIAMHSCSENDYTMTSDGLRYKMIDNAPGKASAAGDILQLTFTYSTEEDSVLYDSRSLADSMIVEHKPQELSLLTDALNLLSEGDSAVFILPADSVYEKVLHAPVVPQFRNKMFRWNVRIEKIYSRKEFEETISKKIARSHDIERRMIEQYLLKNNYNISAQESGLVYIPLIQGKGIKAEKGDSVVVSYTAMFLSGEVFDSSDKGTGTVNFVLGSGKMIKGWEEGIAMMKEGGQARLIVPSWQAYGSKGFGPIPAETTVVFDIVLLKVIRNLQ